jgi:hypothetical protein
MGINRPTPSRLTAFISFLDVLLGARHVAVTKVLSHGNVQRSAVHEIIA